MDIRNFFGSNNNNIERNVRDYPPLNDIQRRLIGIYENASTWSPDQVERAIDGVVGATREMVRQRNSQNQTLSILERLLRVRDRTIAQMVDRPRTPEGPPPLRTAPQFVEIRSQVEILPPMEPVARPVARPVAQLRPAARPRVVAPIPYDWSIPEKSTANKKLKVISKAKIGQNCEKECGICFEFIKKGDTLTTHCEHVFCISCWSTWMNSSNSSKTCPTCRLFMPSVTYYKVRATKKRDQQAQSV